MPPLGSASTLSVAQLLGRINTYIINPMLAVLFAVAFVVFLWGVIEFIYKADEPKSRAQGGKHILWGLLGMTIMFSAFGIIYFIANTFGLSVPDTIPRG